MEARRASGIGAVAVDVAAAVRVAAAVGVGIAAAAAVPAVAEDAADEWIDTGHCNNYRLATCHCPLELK